MKKRKATSSYKKQYQKERSRILSTIRRYEKQGGFVNITIPTIPKKITAASVHRLQKIDVKKIRESTDFVDPETGEVFNFQQFQRVKRAATRARKQAALESAKAQALAYQQGVLTPTQAELEWVWMREYASTLHPKAYWVIVGFFNKKRKLLGLNETAKMIQKGRSDGTFSEIYSFGYDSGLITGSLNKLLNYVGASQQQRMDVVIENEEDFEDS